MKKIIIIGVLIILLSGLAFFLFRETPIAVKVITVSRGDVEETVANTRAGTVESCQRSKLALLVGGRIDQLFVDEGDHVEQGQLLIKLWNMDKAALVLQAKANYTLAQFNKRSICISAEFDQREANRLLVLSKKKLVAVDVVDSAKTKATASALSCEGASAEVEATKANLDLQEAILEQTVLRAPFSGVVAELHGKMGEYLTPSPPGVATPPAIDLINVNCLYVSAPIDEVDAAAVKLHMPVRITMDAFRGRNFPGKVRKIAPYVLDLEKQARTVEIEADFLELPTDITLLVGYSADIEILLKKKAAVLRIPTEALSENNTVYRVNPKTNRLEERQLKIGLSNWHFSEILDGLSEGDKVVISLDVKGLQQGALVQEKP